MTIDLASIRTRLEAANVMADAYLPEYDKAQLRRYIIASINVERTIDRQVQVVPSAMVDVSIAEFVAGAHRDLTALLAVAEAARGLLPALLNAAENAERIPHHIADWRLWQAIVGPLSDDSDGYWMAFRSRMSEDTRELYDSLKHLADLLGYTIPS